MKAIILAGGSGTRLWPLSRNYHPKQFLKLKNMDKSIFQLTFERCIKLTEQSEIYIVTNNNYKFLALVQIEELGHKIAESQILIEPEGKNTLPAIYYGVKEIQKQCEDIVVVLPSDHLICEEDKFIQTIKNGEQLANNYIITYGIRPNKPHTGFGYIKPAAPLAIGYKVDNFKEKPNFQTALDYLEKGYLWNSGMFMFRSDIFTQEVREYNQEVYEAFQLSDIEKVFTNTPNISIDFGIMEKSERVAVIPLDVKWSDLGSFDTFYDEFNRDENGNVAFNEDILLINSSNNLLYTDKNKTVALVGVDELIVVDEKDALLICKKDQSQKVKEVVNKLKESNNSRVDMHLTTYRPWGSVTILEEGLFYKIKRITVLPGKKLNLQMQNYSSEHLVVIKGTAKVTAGDKETIVKSGESIQSVFKCRLENPGNVLLEVIEIQLGEYLEDANIFRIEA